MSKFQDNWNSFLDESRIDEKTRAEKEGVKLPSTAEQLKKYVAKDFTDPEYYMQFSNVNKLGINPKSGYRTPLGIYSYPITDRLYRQFVAGKLPFAQDRKYIIVFKPREDKNIVVSLGKRNNGGLDDKAYAEAIENLLSKELADGETKRGAYVVFRRFTQGEGFKPEQIKEIAEAYTRKKDFIQKVYDNRAITQFTELIADEFLNEKPYGEVPSYEKMLNKIKKNWSWAVGDSYFTKDVENLKKDFTEEDYRKFVDWLDAQDLSPELSAEVNLKKLTDYLNYDPTNSAEAIQQTQYWTNLKDDARSKTNLGLIWALSYRMQNNPRVWRTLFQKHLGIDGVVDAGGEGLIHPSEKTQAVFFSKDAVEQVTTIRNTETPDAINRRKDYLMKSTIQRAATEFYTDTLGVNPTQKMIKSALGAINKVQESHAWKIDGANNLTAFVKWLFGQDTFPPQQIPGEFDGQEEKYEKVKKESLNQFHAILTTNWIEHYFKDTIGEAYKNARDAAWTTEEPLQTQLAMEAQSLRREAADFIDEIAYEALEQGKISPREAKERIEKELKEYLEAYGVIIETVRRATAGKRSGPSVDIAKSDVQFEGWRRFVESAEYDDKFTKLLDAEKFEQAFALADSLGISRKDLPWTYNSVLKWLRTDPDYERAETASPDSEMPFVRAQLLDKIGMETDDFWKLPWSQATRGKSKRSYPVKKTKWKARGLSRRFVESPEPIK